MAESEPEILRQITVHNEQTKIRATLLNTVAAGFIVVGIITPAANALRDGLIPARSLVATVFWLFLAVLLHSTALMTLRSMK
ncbi:MAG: hypothetical protein K2X54_07795 [Methylobacterium organophilum]|nr:hypothetical protein [Methylobacterium organophilum]